MVILPLTTLTPICARTLSIIMLISIRLNYTIKIRDVDIDIDNKGYEKFTALKLKNPNLKVMISVRDISPRAHAKKCLFSS